jgi:DHA2 family multidrug resistance protein
MISQGNRSESAPKLTTHPYVIRKQFHPNMLGLNVQLGNVLTVQRLLGFGGAFSTHSTGLTATGRAAEALAMQVRQQAFTLAISGSFIVLATCCAICLVIVALMSKVPTQYHQVIASNAGTE